MFARDLATPPQFAYGASAISICPLEPLLAGTGDPTGAVISREFNSKAGAAWSLDSELILWDGASNVRKLTADGAVHAAAAAGQHAATLVSVQGAPRFAEFVAACSRISGRTAAIAVAPRLAPALFSRTTDGYLRGESPSTPADAIHSSRVQRILLAPVQQPALYGETAVFPRPGVTGRALPQTGFSPTPLVETVSGHLLGWAAPPDELHMPDEPALEALLRRAIEQDRSDDPGLFLRTVEINTTAKVAVIAYHRQLTARAFRIIRYDDGGSLAASRLLSCRAGREPGWDARLEGSTRPFRMSLTQLGSGEWPLPAVALTAGGHRKLVVFLHGGPASPTLHQVYSMRWRRYLDLGYDVLAPAYSGSSDAGPATRNRLVFDASAALQRDAATVARALSSPPLSNYSEVLIHGESFGAILAAHLASQVSAKDVKLALVGPWLEYRSPNDWSDNPAQEFAFEKIDLGFVDAKVRNRFFDDAQRSYNAATSHPTLVVVGGRDRKIGRSLLAGASSAAKVRIVEVDGAAHEILAVHPATWSALSTFALEGHG